LHITFNRRDTTMQTAPALQTDTLSPSLTKPCSRRLLPMPFVRHQRRRIAQCGSRAAEGSSPCQQGTCSRRQWLKAGALAGVMLAHSQSQAASAGSLIAEYEESKLPKGYLELSSKLAEALREAIEMDMSDAKEIEVRRKADTAKGLVKDWLSDWRDNGLVSTSTSHRQIKSTILQLGQFYSKNGQRARLSSEVGRTLLDNLGAAIAVLPAKK